MDENNLFREAFNRQTIEHLAGLLVQADSGLDGLLFSRVALENLDSLGFGQRAQQIVRALEAVLPVDFTTAASVLYRALGPEPVAEELKGFEGFYIMPLTMYVSRHGLDLPDISLPLLYEMTKRFSAEGDIRPFLQRYPDMTLEFLHRLTQDPSPFARRLASEGTRPRLPLFSRLPEYQKNPALVIALLDRLYTDPNLMVRRSVANNINDISKDNPEVAVTTLERWRRENPGPQLDWMIRHGLRTLVKQGHPGALALLGKKTLGLDVGELVLSTGRLHLGESLEWSVRLHSTAGEDQNLSLNYVIHFCKARGDRRPKVFRLPDRLLTPGETVELTRVHKFLPFKNQSFYSGEHLLEITVNGQVRASEPFWLEVE